MYIYIYIGILSRGRDRINRLYAAYIATCESLALPLSLPIPHCYIVANFLPAMTALVSTSTTNNIRFQGKYFSHFSLFFSLLSFFVSVNLIIAYLSYFHSREGKEEKRKIGKIGPILLDKHRVTRNCENA